MSNVGGSPEIMSLLASERQCDVLKHKVSPLYPALGNWMERLPKWFIETKTLKETTVIGTHDAGAYNLVHRVDPGDPKFIKDPKWLKYAQQHTDILGKQSLAQGLDVYDQLRFGARYLDVRVGFDPQIKQFRTQHYLFGVPLDAILDQVSRFLNEHPKEIVIIALSKVHGPEGGDSYPKEALEELKRHLHKLFKGKMIPNEYGFNTKKLIELMEEKLQVLVLLDAPTDEEDMFIRDMKSHLGGQFANTVNVCELVIKSKERLNEYDVWNDHKANENRLWRSYWTLTPYFAWMVEQAKLGDRGLNLYSLTMKANATLKDWIEYVDATKGETKEPPLGQIFMVDYIEEIDQETRLRILSQGSQEVYESLLQKK